MLSPISDRETAALMRLGSAGFFDGSELSLLLRPHDGAAGGPALPPLSALEAAAWTPPRTAPADGLADDDDDDREAARAAAAAPLTPDEFARCVAPAARDRASPAEECVVCTRLFGGAAGGPSVALPCGHCFHAPCARRWLTGRSSLCPLCRADTRVVSPGAARAAPRRRRAAPASGASSPPQRRSAPQLAPISTSPAPSPAAAARARRRRARPATAPAPDGT